MWFILDKFYNAVGVLNDNTPNGCPLLDTSHHETLEDGYTTLEFTVPSTHKTANLLEIEGFIIYKDDMDGSQELFRIKHIVEEHGETSTKKISCETAATADLLDSVVRPKTFTGQSLSTIINYLLGDTEWDLGRSYYNDIVTIEFNDYPTVLQAVRNTIEQFGAEIEFKVIFDGTKIAKRVVNLYDERGNKTNKTFTYDLDLKGVTRNEDSDKFYTAMIAVGKEDSNGNKISVANAMWTPPKPYMIVGDYICDTDALQQWCPSGLHKYGVFNDSNADNAIALAQNALEELKKYNKPTITYETSVATLEQLTGYEHTKVSIGDTVRIQDPTFYKTLYLEARVLEKETDILNPEQSSIVLGEYKLLQVKEILSITQLQKKIEFKEHDWNKAYNQSKDNAVVLDEVKDNITYKCEVFSTKGSMFKNGVIDTEIVAAVYKGKDNITTTLDRFAFDWKKLNSDGTTDLTWVGADLGKQFTLTSEEVDGKATFQVEITVDSKIVAVGTITIVDVNDAIITDEKPTNPVKGQMYIDKTFTPPVLYTYNGTIWEKQQLSVGDLDPELTNTVGTVVNEVEAIDGRVTTAESTISQLNSSITSKVESATFNDLKDVVDTQQSTIEQQAGQISSKVEKNGVISSINQTAETVKIDVSKMDITGVATYFAQGNPNMMPQRMDSFEQLDLGTLPTSMFLGTTSLTQKAVTNLYSYDGSRSIVLQTGTLDDGWLYLSPSSTNYNIPVQMSATYIFSFYAYNPDAVKTANIRGAVKLSDGTFVRAATKTLAGSEGWYRYEVKVTIPTGITALNTIIYNYTPNVPIYFDAFQFERVDPNAIKASPFKPASTTIINGGNVTTQSLTADHIKSLNGLNVGNGQFTVDANGNVVIGQNAILRLTKFEGLRGNTVYIGDYGAKIDTSIAGTIKRARLGVNDNIYIAIDDNNNFNFVMDDGSFNPKFSKDADGHRILTLGSANIAGLATGEAVHIRNVSNTTYAKLAASDIVATSSLDVWGAGSFRGDVTVNSNAGMLKLNGNNQAFIEFSYGGARKGFIGNESATGSNMVIASDKDEIILRTDVCRIKVDNGVARVDFKNAQDTAYIPIYASNITYNSVRDRKKNIETFVGTEAPDGTIKTALDEITETPIRKYHFNEESDTERKHVGLILDEAPVDVVDIRGEGIDAYAMGVYAWSAIQELKKENEELRNELAEIKALLKKNK
ncbi:phage tail spike protein [Priestia megaterium]|uniref:phage tail spike protein n=1 Tax=Priestia megaterium TaxID=1404 RepID=UPI003CC566F8